MTQCSVNKLYGTISFNIPDVQLIKFARSFTLEEKLSVCIPRFEGHWFGHYCLLLKSDLGGGAAVGAWHLCSHVYCNFYTKIVEFTVLFILRLGDKTDDIFETNTGHQKSSNMVNITSNFYFLLNIIFSKIRNPGIFVCATQTMHLHSYYIKSGWLVK